MMLFDNFILVGDMNLIMRDSRNKVFYCLNNGQTVKSRF